MGIQSKCTVFMFHQQNECFCWDSDGRGEGHKWRTNGAHYDGAVLLGKEGPAHCCFRVLFKISLPCHVKHFQICESHMEKTILQSFTSQAAVQIDGCSL